MSYYLTLATFLVHVLLGCCVHHPHGNSGGVVCCVGVMRGVSDADQAGRRVAAVRRSRTCCGRHSVAQSGAEADRHAPQSLPMDPCGSPECELGHGDYLMTSMVRPEQQDRVILCDGEHHSGSGAGKIAAGWVDSIVSPGSTFVADCSVSRCARLNSWLL